MSPPYGEPDTPVPPFFLRIFPSDGGRLVRDITAIFPCFFVLFFQFLPRPTKVRSSLVALFVSVDKTWLFPPFVRYFAVRIRLFSLHSLQIKPK